MTGSKTFPSWIDSALKDIGDIICDYENITKPRWECDNFVEKYIIKNEGVYFTKKNIRSFQLSEYCIHRT